MTSRHTLQQKLRTRDGHKAEIWCRRNAFLGFWKSYYAIIFSAQMHDGNQTAAIYRFEGAVFDKVKLRVKQWTIDQLFAENPYILDKARLIIEGPKNISIVPFGNTTANV